jgi:hypothetical protein
MKTIAEGTMLGAWTDPREEEDDEESEDKEAPAAHAHKEAREERGEQDNEEDGEERGNGRERGYDDPEAIRLYLKEIRKYPLLTREEEQREIWASSATWRNSSTGAASGSAPTPSGGYASPLPAPS